MRRLPGSLNDAESAAQDSFAERSASLPQGLLDTPHYTAFLLTAPQLGPDLEIYRIDPPPER